MFLNKLTIVVLAVFSAVFFIIGFLFSYDYLIVDLKSSIHRMSGIRSIGEYTLMYLSFIYFLGFLYRYKFLKLISILLLLLLSVNLFISYCCYFVYGTGFNIGMAVSVLDSNLNEAGNMITNYLVPLVLVVIFFILNIILIKKVSKFKFTKYLLPICLLWILLPIAFYMKHELIGSKNGKSMVKNIFYHFKDFKSAYDLQQRMEGIKSNKIFYEYNREQEGVDTIVVLIGESGRRQNMSLYGYSRNTTPIQKNEVKNMFLFQNVFSPAGITNLSIPLILSNIDSDRYPEYLEELADNIVNLGNQYGYNTTWISTQNNIKGVTEIASFATNKKWINGYDIEIIPSYIEFLNNKNKNLIVIHINGSHPNPCLRYPSDQIYFDEGNDLDCYDNSIKYTDTLIGELLKPLKDKNAAFVYFTDHGLKYKEGKLIHGDSKESSKVPFYVWFGKNELKEKYRFSKGMNDIISSTYLYPVVMKLFGLEEIKLEKVENQKYLQLNHKTINYLDLTE